MRLEASGRLALLAATLVGCFNAGITPRTADLLRQGEVGGGASFTAMTVAPGEVALADGDHANGNSGQRALVHPIAYLAPHVANTQGWLRVGATDWLEIGLTAGMQRLGGELRFALADEHANDPLSSALGVAAMWRPFAGVDGPWTALSLDTSRRLKNLTLFADIVLSYGPEDHAMGLESHQQRECGGFGDEGCSEYGPPRHFKVSQLELRANTALGVALPTGEGGGVATISLVPYFIAWRDDEGAAYDCIGCSYLEPVGLEESWGVHLVVGFHFNGAR